MRTLVIRGNDVEIMGKHSEGFVTGVDGGGDP